MINDHILEEIRQRLPLSIIIGRHIKLIKKGRIFTGLCPFHSEKTPSFSVNDDQGSYRCFGCGARGDVIDYVRAQEGLTFTEAVEELARQCHLEMPKILSERLPSPEKIDAYMALEKTCLWFQEQLKQTPEALTYCHNRGLCHGEIHLFRIGWAPAHGFTEASAQWLLKTEIMIEAGLITRSHNGTLYPRFRDRLIFPIFDKKGRVIAFGGRTLKEDHPKYLNSPETPLFIKGKNLYFSRQKQPFPSKDHPLVVVEGYLDVIASGRFFQTAACLGTAVSATQIHMMWKKSPEPIICFDGDNAGKAASFKMAQEALPLLKAGHSLKFAFLPPQQDPHGLIQNGIEGITLFKQAISKALPLCDFLFNTLFPDKLLTPERKAQAMAQWHSWVDVIADHQVKRLYKNYLYERRKVKQIAHVPTLSPHLMHDKILLGMVLLHPSLLDSVKEYLAGLSLPDHSPWLHLRNYMVSFSDESFGHSLSIERMQDTLPTILGDNWQGEIDSISRHIPKNLKNDQDIEAYWLDLFNAHQTQFYQEIEIAELKNEATECIHAWERLKNLSNGG